MNEPEKIDGKEQIKPSFWQPHKKKLTKNFFKDFMIGVGIGIVINAGLRHFYYHLPILLFISPLIVFFLLSKWNLVAIGMIVITTLIMMFNPLLLIRGILNFIDSINSIFTKVIEMI